MKSFMLVGVAGAMAAMAGCVSIEETRAQLQSKDPTQVKLAEDTIYTIATTGYTPPPIVRDVDLNDRVEYIKLLSNEDVLFKIMENARGWSEIRGAAFDSIDFSKSGMVMKFLARCSIPGSDEEKLGRARKLVSLLSDEEMCAIITNKAEVISKIGSPVNYELLVAIDERYAKEGMSADVIAKKMVGGVITAERTTESEEMRKGEYKKRLMGMLGGMTDEKLIKKILPKVEDAKGREILFSKLSEANIVAIASNYGEKLDVCVDAARYVKNQNDLLKVMGVILHMLANEERLKRYDENKIRATAAKFPKLSAEILAILMNNENCHWKYLVDQVPSAVAYQLITEGKVGCASAEEVIAEKIDKESIDAKVYSKAKSLATKKSLLARMSDAQKKAVRELDEKAYALVLEKAKAAAKDTFELGGFYLGMTYDDMKVVFAHHFPDFEIVEDKDSNGAPLLFASGQRTPFCFVGKETGKVYEFNFGKKMVEKWYKYDVRNSLEWAMAFGRANNMKMELNSQTEKTSVYDSNTHRSYDAWLLQERYTHKDSKGYSLTYHGEFKINCGGPDIVAALIRAKAEKDFWHTGSDEGALKVKYAD